VLGVPTRFGLGFMLGFGPGPKSFGHPGSGGSVGFADPDAGIGFGYAMNRMIGVGPDDGRAERLVDALYRCL
jgi:CubicO group peptidase (beta-lactamase class C family)